MNKLNQITKETTSFLSQHLDKNLKFHNLEHSLWVKKEAETIADFMNICSKSKELLCIAAICHDTGYVQSTKNNEPLGAKYAQEIMRKYNYPEHEIEKVKTWILETNLQLTPTSIESRILRDADTSYIGTNHFKSWSNRLFKEYVYLNKVSNNINDWNKIQLQFFENHIFYTGFANLYRRPLKAYYLSQLKEDLH